MTPHEAQVWLAERAENGQLVKVSALVDPVVEQLGHAPTSTYAEHFLLPTIGPSALWALRRLSTWLGDPPLSYEMHVGELAVELGLGKSTALHSPIMRTMARLVGFAFADVRCSQYLVRRAVAPLSQAQLRRLPPRLLRAHNTLAS